AVFPVPDRRGRHRAMPRDAGPEIVGARRRAALLALGRRGVRAARADDLARLPAAGKVVLRRLGTAERAARITVDGEPGAILLGITVPRVHLEEALLLLVVHGAPELLVERAPGGGVEAPRRAVRDDERVEAPLRELLEEDVGRLGRLVAVGGQLARVGILRIARERVALPDRLLRLRPVRGCDALGVVVDAPEVEVRAVAREVAGVGGWMRTLALHEGERAQEGVDGEGRVHVEVAEEDLPSGRLGDAEAAEG